MSRVSGWCGQLGKPDHKGCRVPAECSCGCPEDAAKVAKQRSVEQEFAALAWDNRNGPDRAALTTRPGPDHLLDTTERG